MGTGQVPEMDGRVSPGGRPSEGKVRIYLTLTPAFIKAARKIEPNLSRFVEAAGWKEIKRQKKRVGPGEGPRV